jgi:hypothetical protein
VTVHVLSPPEMATICPGAVACYGDDTLLIQGEPGQDGTPISEALVHEYGHHVAFHRVNDPFPGGAVAWGPKRWASYANVCTRALAGTAFPSDEGEHYEQNPGEAFADSYRIVNGGNPSLWRYDNSFLPDDAARAAIVEDVVHPYSTATIAQQLNASLSARGSRTTRVGTLATPLDGQVRLNVSTSRGLRATVSLVDAADHRLLARSSGGWATGVNCGTRQMDVVAERGSKVGGRLSVSVVAP